MTNVFFGISLAALAVPLQRDRGAICCNIWNRELDQLDRNVLNTKAAFEV